MDKETALKRLALRKEVNGPKKIDNASLPAGAPMYYYCQSCDALVSVKPEGWYRNPPPKLCDDCVKLKEAGLI